MRIPLLVLTSFFAVFLTGNAFAQNKKATPANVAVAIEKCVSFLIAEQKKDGDRKGSWTGYLEYGTGQTSLVTLALLSAGKNAKSPEISRALTYIRANKPKKNVRGGVEGDGAVRCGTS